ncbi:g-protein coupled receptor [Holotrichia oblita]|uniref:G-protein coupled receptor n=1 Tax=Holotrichia oblita TaxID=644536 RepID=A0ACB9SZB9_HOLOL|nr:g-protein coupled receptor [Holotrichia oblita]
MHTATNYYLFSLAISDLFLLISALLPEMYRIWSPENYIFGQTFCIIQGFAAETSVNATVLTITAFTVERYVAICHPFLSHTIAKLSRIVKFIIAIWVAALCLAIPQAIQFGVEYDVRDNVETSMCSVVTEGLFQHSFEISTFLFFVGPMTLITVLYVLIALKLRKSGKQCRISRSSRNSVAQKKVIKMLDGQFIFSLDMATAHDAGNVTAIYNELQINFIAKSRNDLNVPQRRPIERFWKHLKREVYSCGWKASSTEELKTVI